MGSASSHHRNHESRTGRGLNRMAFMEKAWSEVQQNGTNAVLKTGVSRLLMFKI